MKNKKKFGKKIVYFIVLVLNIFVGNYTYASISLPSGMDSIYSTNDPIATSIGGQLIWIAQTIFYAAAVIIVIFAGVKYMGAAPDAKAEFKRKLIYMVTGAIILFAAGSIVGIIGDLAFYNI